MCWMVYPTWKAEPPEPRVLPLVAVLKPLVCPVASSMLALLVECCRFKRCLGGAHSSCSLHVTSTSQIHILAVALPAYLAAIDLASGYSQWLK